MVKDHRHQELAILPEYPSLAVEAEGTSTSTRLIQIVAAIGVGLLLILTVQYEVSRRRLTNAPVAVAVHPVLHGNKEWLASKGRRDTDQGIVAAASKAKETTVKVSTEIEESHQCTQICVVAFDKTKKPIGSQQCLSRENHDAKFTCDAEKCNETRTLAYPGKDQSSSQKGMLIYTVGDTNYSMKPMSVGIPKAEKPTEKEQVQVWHTVGILEDNGTEKEKATGKDNKFFKLTCKQN